MIQKVAPQRHGTQQDPGRRPPTPTEITERLSHEFPELERDTVARWVRDTLACLRHLGMGADPYVIERLAREHLTSIVHSPISAHPSTAATVGPHQVARERPGARLSEPSPSEGLAGGGSTAYEPGTHRRFPAASAGHRPVHLAIG